MNLRYFLPVIIGFLYGALIAVVGFWWLFSGWPAYVLWLLLTVFGLVGLEWYALFKGWKD